MRYGVAPRHAAGLAVVFLFVLAVVLSSRGLRADALVVTRAMQATTIVEVFVDGKEVRVELEIGLPALGAFASLLAEADSAKPDMVDASPAQADTSEAIASFQIRNGDAPLGFTVERTIRRSRTLRDEITGEALAPNSEAEQVVFVELRALLGNQPRSLVVVPPRTEDSDQVVTDIGFVLHHLGVAVNDFRYLSAPEAVDLDWDDPWYSRFRNRNLKRQFDAPLSAFLYVEPFEVRKEIVVRPKDLQYWVDLGLNGQNTIRPEDYPRIFKQSVKFLAKHGPLSIDGQRVEPKLDRVHFIRRTLRRTGIVDPPEELDLNTATLGVVFVAVTEGLPQEVTLKWDLFQPRIATIACATTDEAGPLPWMVTVDDPILRWKNSLVAPTIPTFLELEPPPESHRLPIPWLGLSLGAIGIVLMAWTRRWVRPMALSVIALAVMASVPSLGWMSVTSPFQARPSVSAEDARQLVAGLLHNVYTAMDRRDEELVYDRLALSVTGELLRDVYLQQRQSLQVESQGGARVRVTDVSLSRCEPVDLQGKVGFSAECAWTVTGDVSHWGHTHARTNAYKAELQVESVDGRWRISDFLLLGLDRP